MSDRKIITGRDKICKDIADALGIKKCRSLQINMRLDEIVTVKAEFLPVGDGIEQLSTIFKEYELVEKKEQTKNENNKSS